MGVDITIYDKNVIKIALKNFYQERYQERYQEVLEKLERGRWDSYFYRNLGENNKDYLVEFRKTVPNWASLGEIPLNWGSRFNPHLAMYSLIDYIFKLPKENNNFDPFEKYKLSEELEEVWNDFLSNTPIIATSSFSTKNLFIIID